MSISDVLHGLGARLTDALVKLAKAAAHLLNLFPPAGGF
jgi:hypothetical protein